MIMMSALRARVTLAALSLTCLGAFCALPSQASAAEGSANLPIVRPTGACGDLAKTDLAAIGGAGSHVASATEKTGVQGQLVCSVEGVLAPSISFRVELPVQTWTQRYLQTGCGGLCGNLSLQIGAADGCPTVQAAGFVVASTDMGHQGMGGEFGGDPQKRADFAYRGVHLTAVAAKVLIRAYYGQTQRYAYFSGCSDGGREALVEAQRFPQDFDGIVAGAPAMNFQVQNSLFHGWQAVSNTGSDGKAILLAPRLPILHRAVMKACDGLDGQVDGLISTPAACHFDPMTLVCKPGQDAATCLTMAEATVVRRFYEGPRDPVTGERLTQGGPQYGSELAWAGVYVPFAGQPIFSERIALDAMPNLIFERDGPTRLADLHFDRATFERLRARHALFDATNPDLSGFQGRGGKLVLFHGWADPHISPINTIAYHDAVRRQMGAATAQGFERLYLMPGMYHCSGGEGPSRFDLLTPLMAWVEHGEAPEAIVTHQAAPRAHSDFGQPGAGPRAAGAGAGVPPSGAAPPQEMDLQGNASARSRPVYPYPYIAAYSGKGDPNQATSYVRGPAKPAPTPTWLGSDFYQPYDNLTL